MWEIRWEHLTVCMTCLFVVSVCLTVIPGGGGRLQYENARMCVGGLKMYPF